MDRLFEIDWGNIFVPNTSLLEIMVRGTIVYLALFLMLRIVRRETSSIGVTDLLVIVLIADAAQNALAGEYTSITDGVLLVAVIIGWSYALERLAYQFPSLRNAIHPPALPLVKDGQINRRNMAKELLTDDELASALRLQGAEKLSDVKMAYMESDGRISVVTKSGKSQGAQEPRNN